MSKNEVSKMYCRNFSNTITTNSGILLPENSTLEFPPFLKPALETLLLNADNYLRFGEDKLFEKLLNPYTISDAKDLIVNIKIPIVYLIVLVFFTALLLIALPFVCFVNKYNGVSDAIKTQYCFGLETLGLIFSVVWIFVGISIYLPAGNLLYNSVQKYPDIARNMIQNINSSIWGYKVQVEYLDVEIKHLRGEMAGDIESMPRFVAESVMDFLKPNLDIILASFVQIEALLDLGVATSCAELNKTMSDYKDEIADLFSGYNFGQQLEMAFAQVSQKELSLAVDIALSNNGEEPLTANISQILHGLDAPLMGINLSVGSFQNAVEKEMLLRIPGYKIDTLRMIILFPVIYSGIFICLLATSVFHGLHHLKVQLRTKTYLGKLNVTISILNFTMKFLMFFLWMMFLLTGIIYLIFWPMAIACRSMADGTVYRKYFDKANLWNNNTWIDNALKDTLQFGNTSVESVMDACENNETLVSALKINKTIIEHFSSIPLYINRTILEDAFNRSIGSITLVEPENFNSFIEHAEKTGNKITLNLSQTCPELLESDVQAYTVNLDKINKIMIATKIYNENFTKKIYELKHEWSKSLFKNISSSIACSVRNLKNYVHFMVNDKIGKCYIIPYTMKQIRFLTCNHLLFVIMALLISISIISFSTLFSLILIFRVTNYVRGVVQFYKCSEFSERYSSNQSRSIALCKLNNNRVK